MFLISEKAKKIGVAIFSVLVVFSTLAFLFQIIFVKWIMQSKNKDLVAVLGVQKDGDFKKDEKKEKAKKQTKSEENKPPANIFFENLKTNKLGAPIKKETAGNYYVGASSAVVIDVDTQTILHYQEGKKRMAIASLTKMMTAVLVMENISQLDDEIITIDEEVLSAEGTKVGCPRTGYCPFPRFQLGEKLSASSVLKAMLLDSANDAAIALGKHISGSQENFAKLMNKKARELGLQDTNFCNPSGLDMDDRPGQCFSSAYDLARIVTYSFQYEKIWEILKIKETEISSIDGTIIHKLKNTDLLLEEMPNCLGGKTGFTYEAGKSLMLAAHLPENKNHRVVAVILDDNYRWQSMQGLLNWVFSAYQWPENK